MYRIIGPYLKRRDCIFLLFFFLAISIFSCSEEDSGFGQPEKELSKRPFISSFSVLKDKNQNLLNDYYGEIVGDSSIILFCHGIDNSENIIPSFEGNFSRVVVNGEKQVSGYSVQNFNNVVLYELEDSVGNKASYKVYLKTLNGIPRIDIWTEEGKEIESDTEYLNAKIRIGNCPEVGFIDALGKVKGRGNATWSYPKKPYKIKFDEKQFPFGFSPNRDWVLLAEACDRTLLRTAYMCEVSKAVGVEYTINYQYVDLFVNNNYRGTYLFTDHIERAKQRINVESDGFILEHDNYYEREPLFLKVKSWGFSFKYPNPEREEIVLNDDNYNYIKSKMTDFWNVLDTLNKDSTNLAYQEIIDIESFAKWYLVAEITATRDPNKYFVLQSRLSKLKMYPLWDAEWSLGAWPVVAWGKCDGLMVDEIIWRKTYFKRLLRSEAFVKTVIAEWEAFKLKIPEVKERIDIICDYIKYAQKMNFEKWPESPQKLNVTFPTWGGEISYIRNFFDMRMVYLDLYFGSLL